MNTRMKILIAYDGSDCARAALDDLRRAGLPEEADAIVASVADVWLPPPSGYELAESVFDEQIQAIAEKTSDRAAVAVEKVQALAIDGSRRVQSSFPAWNVRAEAYAGSPAWEIIKKADEWKPDLVVVGSLGHSALGRLVLGSVSQKIVTESRSSVRVSRGRGENPDSPVRILIGVDGSTGADAAVRAVTERVWPSGSQARVVAALDLMMVMTLEWVEEFDDNERAAINKVVEAAVEQLSAAGLAASSVIKKDDPKHLLVKEAEEWKADCIFVGARGLRRIERFLIGSVSSAVAARAHCSVEIVHLNQTS